MAKLSYAPPFVPPDIVSGPWTPAARQRALEQEVEAHASRYIGRALQERAWSPWQHLPLEEIRQRGWQLSAPTIDLVEGFLGVEEYVGDYVQEGLTMFRRDRARRNLQLQWGAEEAKHGVVWELVLKESGVRTDQQLRLYIDQVRDEQWNLRQHPGMESPLGSTAYAMVQERATYYHYQAIRGRIRAEYGLAPTLTAEEQRRGAEIGAVEACRLVGRDELAHHVLFLHLVRSHLKYFPSRTFAELKKVFAGFTMPALRFLPNRRAFLKAVRCTAMYSSTIYREKVYAPVLQALGLEKELALTQVGPVALQETIKSSVLPQC